MRESGRRFREARDNYNKIYQKEFDKLHYIDNPKLMEIYRKALIKEDRFNDGALRLDYGRKNGFEDATIKELQEYFRDDFVDTTNDVFATLNLPMSESLSNASRSVYTAQRNHLDSAYTYANDWLGSYANEPITSVMQYRNKHKSATTLPAYRWVADALRNYTERDAYK